MLGRTQPPYEVIFHLCDGSTSRSHVRTISSVLRRFAPLIPAPPESCETWPPQVMALGEGGVR